MAFIDELNIFIKAGNGGSGVVRWRHEKGREFGGPSGGNGGSGGDVYIVGVRDINLLSKYKHKKEFVAQNGEDGRKDSEHGRDGEDLLVNLPMGSIVTNHETGEVFSVESEGENILILKGGNGGRGNETFKSSTNQNPKEWTAGQDGQQADFSIEMELIVDVGLIGLPNAGKSSLLNAITGAKAKTADYPFTTLEPNLVVLYGFILADIPGLIEGAGSGKGLGYKFLRHIKRTKKLLHLISLENEDVLKTYEMVRSELKEYDNRLGGLSNQGNISDKQETIVLTKKDLVDNGVVEKATKLLSGKGKVYTISIYDDKSLKIFVDELVKTLRE